MILNNQLNGIFNDRKNFLKYFFPIGKSCTLLFKPKKSFNASMSLHSSYGLAPKVNMWVHHVCENCGGQGIVNLRSSDAKEIPRVSPVLP